MLHNIDCRSSSKCMTEVYIGVSKGCLGFCLSYAERTRRVSWLSSTGCKSSGILWEIAWERGLEKERLELNGL